MKKKTTLSALALTVSLTAVHAASTIINPFSVSVDVAASAGSSANYLLSGAQSGGGSSLTTDGGAGSSTTLATGTLTSVALNTVESLDNVANSYVSPPVGTGTYNYFTGEGSGADETPGTPPTFTFVLDGSFDNIDSIIIWNYTHNNEGSQASAFDLTFYSDAGATTQVGDTITGGAIGERAGSATVEAPDQITFASTYSGVQSFTLTLTDNYIGNRVGLGEVRLTTIPEPSSAALLLGLVGASFAFVRRRA